MTTPAAVAWITGRDKIFRGAILPVMVKMVYAERIGVLRIRPFPADGAAAPAARMRTGADDVIQDHAVNVSAAIGHGKRVAWEHPHPVAHRVENSLRRICGSAPGHAPIVQITESIRLMRFGAVINGAANRVPNVVDVTVVINPPSVHLTQDASPLVWLRTAFHGALRRTNRPLERSERVTVPTKANAVGLAIAVRVMPIVTAINRTYAHKVIVRAGYPSFYRNTHCTAELVGT